MHVLGAAGCCTASAHPARPGCPQAGMGRPSIEAQLRTRNVQAVPVTAGGVHPSSQAAACLLPECPAEGALAAGLLLSRGVPTLTSLCPPPPTPNRQAAAFRLSEGLTAEAQQLGARAAKAAEAAASSAKGSTGKAAPLGGPSLGAAAGIRCAELLCSMGGASRRRTWRAFAVACQCVGSWEHASGAFAADSAPPLFPPPFFLCRRAAVSSLHRRGAGRCLAG